MKTRRLFVGYNPRTRVEFERLNLVARYAGVPRAEFVRQSVAFMDSTRRGIPRRLDEQADPEDLRAVAACNPLRTLAEIREQRPRVSLIEWLQFHACRWGARHENAG